MIKKSADLGPQADWYSVGVEDCSREVTSYLKMWLAKILVGFLMVLGGPKGIQGGIHDGMTFTRTGAAQFFDNYHTIVISIKKEDVNGALT